jgi:hypothetical protein
VEAKAVATNAAGHAVQFKNARLEELFYLLYTWIQIQCEAGQLRQVDSAIF